MGLLSPPALLIDRYGKKVESDTGKKSVLVCVLVGSCHDTGFIADKRYWHSDASETALCDCRAGYISVYSACTAYDGNCGGSATQAYGD